MTPHSSLSKAAAGLAAVCWGFGPVFVKLIDAEGVAVAFARLWLGLAVMLGVVLALRRRISRAGLTRSVGAGVLFGANILLFFTAVKRTSVADAALISSLSPILVVVVAGPWFGERVGRREVSSAVAAILGVAILVVGSSARPEWHVDGDLFAVGALLTWTAFFLTTKRVRSSLGTIEYQFGVMLGAAAAVTPVALLAGQASVDVKGGDWLWLALLVIVPGAVGHGLMSWAHRYVDVSVSSLIVLAQPVVAAVAAALMLDESLGVLQVAGGIVVLAAIAAVLRGPGRLDEGLAREPMAEALSA